MVYLQKRASVSFWGCCSLYAEIITDAFWVNSVDLSKMRAWKRTPTFNTFNY